MLSGRPPPTWRYARYCSSSPGTVLRPTTRNSVRKSPIPCARGPSRPPASPGRSMFARKSTRLMVGSDRLEVRQQDELLLPFPHPDVPLAVELLLPLGRLDDHAPRAAVQDQLLTRLDQLRERSPRLTTAGIPSARARIAECDVRVPASVAIPRIFSLSSWTVRLGVRSRATRITLSPDALQRMVGIRRCRAGAGSRGSRRPEIVEAIHDHWVSGPAPFRLELYHPELERPGRGEAVLPDVARPCRRSARHRRA